MRHAGWLVAAGMSELALVANVKVTALVRPECCPAMSMRQLALYGFRSYMQDSKRDTYVKNRILDYVGEGENGMT